MKIKKKAISWFLVVAVVFATVFSYSETPVSQVDAATASEIVNDADSWVGVTPYVWAGTDLEKGCDCSGFVCAIYRRHGLDLIKTYGVRSGFDMLDNIEKYGTNIGNKISDMEDGCIIIFNDGNHVAICASDKDGKKEIIHASNYDRGTVRDPMEGTTYGKNYKINAIVRPYVLNGKPYSNVVGPGKKDKEDGSDNPSEPQINDDSAINPGYPYTMQTKAVKKANYLGVHWLQTALNKVNNAGLAVDGSFGPITKTAVKKFQKKYGLKVTGHANKTTVLKLGEIHRLNKAVTSLTFNQTDIDSLEIGQKLQLKATVNPATSQGIEITWKSSNKRIASVDANGLVTAKKEGEVRIVATTLYGIKVVKELDIQDNGRSDEWANGIYYNSKGKPKTATAGSWNTTKTNKWFGSATWRAKNKWLRIDDRNYYFDNRGYVLSPGLHTIGKTTYYISNSGFRLENQWKNGKWIDAHGKVTNKRAYWQKTNAGWRFVDSTGWYARGRAYRIDGIRYVFDSRGICKNKK